MTNDTSLPDLKQGPKYGFYPWWPEDGDSWVHPEDVGQARSLIPSYRIWCRECNEGDYLTLKYGELRLRVRRTLWREVSHEGFDIGDQVEILPHGMRNEPGTGQIVEMLWNNNEGGLIYRVDCADGTSYDKDLEARDLKLVEQPAHEIQTRIEPSDDQEEDPLELA